MLGRLPGIGLDIGGQKIKIIQAVKRKKRLEIIKFGSILTPPGTVESNLIVDPDRLGEAMYGLVKRLRLGGKRVVSAVGGQQVYMRSLIMPRLRPDEMRTAVYYQASEFLPIPVENAAIDIFPLRELGDRVSKRTEILFLAVRRQQVDNLEIACRIAGLKLVAVEIEPLSLLRAWGKDVGSIMGLLAMDATRSYLTVFNRGIPVFYRSISMGSTAFHGCPCLKQAEKGPAMDKDGAGCGPGSEPRVMDLAGELKIAMEYYQLQSEREAGSIARMLFCGPFVNGLPECLARELGLEFEVINIINGNTLPRNITPEKQYELQYDFPLALGLAAREVV